MRFIGFLRWALFWSAVGGVGSAGAQAISPKSLGDDFGIVVNQTLTPGGQEFYRRFTDFWREKSDFESYTLVIVESPSRRYGNRIVVNFGQKSLFVGFLPIKNDAIRGLGGEAVEKVYAGIISLSIRMTGDRDPDLSDDEM